MRNDPDLPAGDDPAADARALRQHHLAWLDARLGDAARLHRRARRCLVLAGWLLVPQAAAIAWIAQAMFAEGRAPATLGGPFLCLLLALLGRTALTHAGRRALAQAVEQVKADLRPRLAAAALARGPVALRSARVGRLAQVSVGHVDALGGYYAGYLPARAETLWVPPVLLVAVFLVDWVAGLVLLLTLPLLPVFMMLVGRGAEAAGRRQLLALARAGAHFADRLRGLDLIRVYGRGRAELEHVAEAADEVRDRSMRVLRIAFLSSAVLEFFASVSVALLAVYFGFAYLGMLPSPTAPFGLAAGLFCLLLAPEVYAPLRRLAAHYHDRANALSAVAEMERELGRLPDAAPARPMDTEGDAPASTRPPAPRTDPAAVARPADPVPAIRGQGLALRHPGAASPAVSGLDFRVMSGRRVALVGPSGSGKSSLLEALAGWLPVAEGQLHLAAGRIAFAPQRPWLFRGTLAENIRLGDPDASAARVRAAADSAGVLAFADRLPAGLDTEIGEHGLGLSGGEARRVGLARALLSDPAVLLLDEPTAFLDPGTERRLLDALALHAAGRTLVVATHSPAVVDWADDVLDLGARTAPGGAA
ncbi:thiol reductant ABC exporter subunit CydD [Pseudorhodoferax sp.]|uniref:thiol reductant ABC exporter subunit CydD n=1 Tax=Pseudorhodoferax sp. TaxID=1993553 RepID=UPI002DD61F12|nr:thiol reductant ABC exporter subunit CydD [Pseudorhodoferax sp.]